MSETEYNGSDESAIIEAYFPVSDNILDDFTVQEITLVESLLTPGIQTAIKCHSYRHVLPNKNLDEFKNLTANIKITRPILKAYKFNEDTLEVNPRIYRLADRKMINPNNEEFVLYGCDDSLLNNARELVSQNWNSTPPSDVVRQVLSSSARVINMDIESSSPSRDYIAENIHPFDVVKQQAEVALANSNDPSFLHYMTYENGGTHHFRSLASLSKGTPIVELTHADTAGAKSEKNDIYGGYRNPRLIMTYSFPCDFDLLSDLLNGIDTDGRDLTSMILSNAFLGQFSLSGVQTIANGLGQGIFKLGQTNFNSADQQDASNSGIEQYLLKRQARMNLLEPDKVALRLTVPWNPVYHAGKVIRVNLYNKNDRNKAPIQLYGAGDYLISSMVHTVKRGGFSTTTMDCVSTTVGKGMV